MAIYMVFIGCFHPSYLGGTLKQGRHKFIFALLLLAVSNKTLAAAKPDLYTISAQGLALAPNAGGQDAFRLEGYHKNQAVYGFNNRALLVSNTTLFGVGYAYRLPICDESCFWQFFVQVGGGLSNAGGFLDVTWGSQIPLVPIWLPVASPRFIPSLRIDISSHFFATRTRVLTWSYPLWVGLALSF